MLVPFPPPRGGRGRKKRYKDRWWLEPALGKRRVHTRVNSVWTKSSEVRRALRVQVVPVGVSKAGAARILLSPCLLSRCLVVLPITTTTTIDIRERGARRLPNLRPQCLVCPVRPASPVFSARIAKGASPQSLDHKELNATSKSAKVMIGPVFDSRDIDSLGW